MIELIDKNLLLVDGSIRNALLCVKNILAQDVGCGTSDCAEGTFRHSSFKQIKSGDMVRVVSATGNISLEAEVTDSIMPGVVCIPHGWGHNLPGVKLGVALENPGVNINDIIDNRHYDLSGTAVFSAVPVRVERTT